MNLIITACYVGTKTTFVICHFHIIFRGYVYVNKTHENKLRSFSVSKMSRGGRLGSEKDHYIFTEFEDFFPMETKTMKHCAKVIGYFKLYKGTPFLFPLIKGCQHDKLPLDFMDEKFPEIDALVEIFGRMKYSSDPTIFLVRFWKDYSREADDIFEYVECLRREKILASVLSHS